MAMKVKELFYYYDVPDSKVPGWILHYYWILFLLKIIAGIKIFTIINTFMDGHWF